MLCNYTEMKRILEADQQCPMCTANVPPMSLRMSDNPEADFKALADLMKDSGPQTDEDKEDEEDDI